LLFRKHGPNAPSRQKCFMRSRAAFSPRAILTP
jgi:hypothetical protein